jgi:3-methyladenine DNA glycosylase AlkD
MDVAEIVRRFESLSDPDAVAGMARFGIRAEKVYGIRIPALRKLAKEIGKDHELALELWRDGSREARILAAMVDDPARVTEEQLDSWVADLDNWEDCDQCCMNLFDKTTFAVRKCFEWSSRKETFVKRAGFALMARLAWTARDLTNNQIELLFLPIVEQSVDGRNDVKKAISWALRQIGKRNRALNRKAIGIAQQIREKDSKAARWIAGDVLRELQSEAVQKRLAKQGARPQ